MLEADLSTTTTNPDAALLELGAEFRRHTTTIDADWARADAIEEAEPTPEGRAKANAIRDAVCATTPHYHAMLDSMRDTPASTLAGMAVKAVAILEWLEPGGEDPGPDCDHDARVARSLAHNVLAAQARAADADRELIELCARIDWLERGIQTGGGGTTLAEEKKRDRAIEPLRKAQTPLLKQVVRMRATTLAGLRAKAATLALWDGDQLMPHASAEGYWNFRMTRSVFCDLLGAPGVDRKAGITAMKRLRAGPVAVPGDVSPVRVGEAVS